MGKSSRKRIGFLFFFDPNWMGGIIYVANSVRILNYLEDKDKPEIYVFYPERIKEIIDEIDYPYLNKVLWKFPSIPKTFVNSIIVRKNLFANDFIVKYNLNALYPMHYFPVKEKQGFKSMAWFADLQFKYYPEFFTKKKLFENEIKVRFILKNANDLVVSSQVVKDDFYKFYKIPKNLKIHIYHFVSIIDQLAETSHKELSENYGLPKEYFMVSNQFHKHKNHKVVMKALAILKKEGKIVHIVMTGRFPDLPDSPYMQELHNIINENQLWSDISFLGLLPRGDQLLLMKNARAIIQPSLFEGWSTVIEDARSLQVPVIAADLPVNIEQLDDKGTYFSPHDYNKLASLLVEHEKVDKGELLYQPYEQRMKEAAYSFYSIFND